MTLLELVREKDENPEHTFLIRRYRKIWDIPQEVVLVNKNIRIQIKKIEKVDHQLLTRTSTRLPCDSMVSILDGVIQNKVPFKKLLVWNKGFEFTPVDRNQNEDFIPKVIHTPSIRSSGNGLSSFNRYFMKKTQLLYPNY